MNKISIQKIERKWKFPKSSKKTIYLCFYILPLIGCYIPQYLQSLANEALENSRSKSTKGKRQDTKFPGLYKSENYQFFLLKTLTTLNTYDIDGYAYEKKYFAIAKTPKFNLKDDFIFIDPKTQKLFRLTHKIASENNINIYESEKISIFDIMTNFKLTSSSNKTIPIKDGIKKRNPLGNFDFRFGMDEDSNYPKMNKCLDTDIECGFGTNAEIGIETTLSFNHIWDLKIESSISLDAVIGAEIKIPDNFTGNITNIVIFSISKEIPGLGLSFNFLGLEINFGLFFDFNVIFDEISVDIPVGFDYYKGYKIKGLKYFSISGNSIVNPDWEFIITNLPEKSSTNDIIESFKSSKFNATIDFVHSFGLKFVLGDVSLSIDIGLKFPFKYDFKFNDQKCMYPYLEASLELPIKMFYQVFGLTIFWYTIFSSKYEEKIIRTMNFGPFCIGSDMLMNSNSIEEYYCSLGLYNTINLDFKQNETNKNIKLDIKEKYIDKKLCVFIVQNSVNYQLLYYNNITALNDNIFIIDISSTTIDIPIKRNNIIIEDTVIIRFYIMSYGSSKLEELTNSKTINLRFYNDTLTGFIAPHINQILYLQFAGSFEYTVAKLPINENKVLCIFTSNKNVRVPVFSNQIQISNFQSYNTININVSYLVYYKFNVICQNGKQIKAVLNNKVYTASVKNGVAQFTFFSNGKIDFYPICYNNSGKFCQIEYQSPSFSGYHLIEYPNRDGISITGGGFFVEIIPVTYGKSFYYYKTYDGAIKTIRQYSTNVVNAELDIKDFDNYDGFEKGRRICIVEKNNKNNIIPFSRKYFSENTDDLLDSLGIEKNFSLIKNDRNGCFIFHSDLIKKDSIEFLSSKVSDLPISFNYKNDEIKTENPQIITESNYHINSIEATIQECTYKNSIEMTVLEETQTTDKKPKSKTNIIIIATVVPCGVVIIAVIVIIIVWKTNHFDAIYGN